MDTSKIEVLYSNPQTHQYDSKDWGWLTETFGPGLKLLDAGAGVGHGITIHRHLRQKNPKEHFSLFCA